MTNIRKMTPAGLQQSALFSTLVILSAIVFTPSLKADTIVLDDFSQSLVRTDSIVNSGPGSVFGPGDTGYTPGDKTVYINGNVSTSWRDANSVGAGLLWNSRYVTFSKLNGDTSYIAINDLGLGKLSVSHPDGEPDLSLRLTYRDEVSQTQTQRNLASMVNFVINVVSIDQTTVKPTLKVYDSTGASSSAQFSTALTTGVNTFALGSLFSAIDETRVVRIDLDFLLPTATDLNFTELYFAPVPEPSTVAMSLIVVGAVLYRARRRRSTAVSPCLPQDAAQTP